MNLNDVFPIDLSDETRSEWLGNLNKELAECILNYIRLEGYEPYDINYGDTYFIMKYEPNSTISFRLKGLWKHWRFGLWIHSKSLFDDSNYPVIQLFCQHDHQIDKFKPSRSSLCVSFEKSDIENWLEASKHSYDVIQFRIKLMLEFIKEHPILAYDSMYWYDTFIIGHPISRFIKHEYRELKFEYLERFYTYIFSYYAIFKIDSFKKFDEVEDAYIRNIGDGWVSSPRIKVIIKFKPDVSEEDVIRIVNKLLPWKIDKIGKFSTYEYALGFTIMQNKEIYLWE